MSSHTITHTKNLPESELEIGVEISYETLLPHRNAALKKLGTRANVAGFRVGHVPEKILVEKVGELHLLEEAAFAAIEEIVPKLLAEKSVQAVGEPRVSITKLAAGNPLGFTVVLSIMGDVKLSDYKKIASEQNAKTSEPNTVEETEVDEFITRIRTSFAEAGASKTGDKTAPEKILPELTDEFVKKLGDFKNVSDFKEKIKDNLQKEKEHKTREKKRLTLAEAIVSKTIVEVPKAVTESELAKMLARFHDDILRMGMSFEDYSKQIKKTEGDLRKDWRKDAERHGKLQIVLGGIAETEKLEPAQEAIEMEVKHILEHHKDADPARASAYIRTLLTNEKVFEFLENVR